MSEYSPLNLVDENFHKLFVIIRGSVIQILIKISNFSNRLNLAANFNFLIEIRLGDIQIPTPEFPITKFGVDEIGISVKFPSEIIFKFPNVQLRCAGNEHGNRQQSELLFNALFEIRTVVFRSSLIDFGRD